MIFKLVSLINNTQKRKLFLLVFLILFSSFIELLSLGAIIPILKILLEPDIKKIINDILIFVPNFFDLKIFTNLFLNSLNKYQILYFVLGGFFLIYLIKSILVLFISWILISFTSLIQMDLSNRLYKIYLSRPYKFHILINSSRLLRNINWSSTLARGISLFINFLSDILVFTLIISSLIWYQPTITFVIFLLILLIIYFYKRIFKTMIKNFGNMAMYHDGEKTKHALESFGSIKEVILYKLEQSFFSKFNFHNSSAIEIEKKNSFLSGIPRIFLELFAVVLLSFIIIYNSSLNEQLKDNIVIIGFFTLALFKLMPILNRILTNLNSFFYLDEVVKKIYNEFNSSLNQKKLIQENISFEKKIVLNGVQFSYPNNKIIFKNLNLEILKGQKIGIIGKTGGGKSTLINLIIGLLDPDSGSIKIDNEALSVANKKSWQKNINYVPQNIFLLDDTIKKNIDFKNNDKVLPQDKNLLDAIKNASLNDFIDKLPNKTMTKIGEGGAQISGGQRQRLGLARAFYNQRKILVLDESTNSLDKLTEVKILDYLSSNKDLTLIFISHNLDNLSFCDKIYEVKNSNVNLVKENIKK